MQFLESETSRDRAGDSAFWRRMLSIPIVPLSGILLIVFVWILLQVILWWIFTASTSDVVAALGDSYSSALWMLLTAICLLGVFVCIEWAYERSLLGVRDGKRSCIYVAQLVLAASLAIHFLQLAGVITLF